MLAAGEREREGEGRQGNLDIHTAKYISTIIYVRADMRDPFWPGVVVASVAPTHSSLFPVPVADATWQ